MTKLTRAEKIALEDDMNDQLYSALYKLGMLESQQHDWECVEVGNWYSEYLCAACGIYVIEAPDDGQTKPKSGCRGGTMQKSFKHKWVVIKVKKNSHIYQCDKCDEVEKVKIKRYGPLEFGCKGTGRFIKQVLVVRKDLNMRTGKKVAQGAHAAMAVVLDNMNDDIVEEWLAGAFTKICVSCDSEEELLSLQQQAVDAGIINTLITDSGKTEFHGVPTNTVLAIGPYFGEEIDKITGSLKLL